MKLTIKSIEPKTKYNEERFIVTFETKLTKEQYLQMIQYSTWFEIEVSRC